MASAGAEHDDLINEWMASFEELPEPRKDNLKRWFATQKIIIESSGLSEEEWFGYIQWAMDNPFDYEFIKDFPDMPETDTSADAAELSDATKKARALVGAQVPARAPEGEGMKNAAKAEGKLEKELFERFMQNRRS